MKRLLVRLSLALGLVVVLGAIFWFGAAGGWFGKESGPGKIEGKALPAEAVAARDTATHQSAPQGDDDVILFGDLHVHTTISVDAYQFALPLMGGTGLHPLADACDFARYCSAVDFWASTDHAESVTPKRWQEVKDTVRACQKAAGDGPNPDLVSFIGFEWTQVGRTPQDHFGHENVIFKDLDDDKVSARAIASIGPGGQKKLSIVNNLSPLVAVKDFSNRQSYFDFNRFVANTSAEPTCDLSKPSNELPKDCMEYAANPGDLVRRLFDDQKLSPLIIPHGTSWGFYTPPGTTWDKALDPSERPEHFNLIEVFSGHGNSEEYRSWSDVSISADGKKTCPQPTPGYLPSCWRAGEIVEARCAKTSLGKEECAKRVEAARQAYVDMGITGHLTVKGAAPADWLDAGQCTDCFLPAFNFRPQTSVQAGLATSHFSDDAAQVTRFSWGFIGSSDNHRARPGTGYKQVDRRENTEASGPSNEGWQNVLFPQEKADDEVPTPRPLTQDELQKVPGLRTVEAERQAAFLHTGGLAAVHATGRSRDAIWDAMQRHETYATSGQKILLWFSASDANGTKIPMGSAISAKGAPTFTVKAAGAFKQKPGCPSFAKAGLDEARLNKICSGECDNPSDVRARITRIEVVKIRPQKTKGEELASLIQDRFIVHACAPSADGSCTFSFSDPSYDKDGRDALYYVKAIQEAEPMINAEPLNCEKDASGKCVKVNLCYGDYRSGKSDCTAPAEPRAWSSPIYLSYR